QSAAFDLHREQLGAPSECDEIVPVPEAALDRIVLARRPDEIPRRGTNAERPQAHGPARRCDGHRTAVRAERHTRGELTFWKLRPFQDIPVVGVSHQDEGVYGYGVDRAARIAEGCRHEPAEQRGLWAALIVDLSGFRGR